MLSKLDFLTSNRFWAIVIGAISVYLKAKGWIGEPEMYLIATITSAFTVVRTLDRASEVLSPKEPPLPLNESVD